MFFRQCCDQFNEIDRSVQASKTQTSVLDFLKSDKCVLTDDEKKEFTKVFNES